MDRTLQPGSMVPWPQVQHHSKRRRVAAAGLQAEVGGRQRRRRQLADGLRQGVGGAMLPRSKVAGELEQEYLGGKRAQTQA